MRLNKVRLVIGAAGFAGAIVGSIGALTQSKDNTSGAKKGSKAVEHAVVDVPAGREVATIAGGCFWCTEAVFKELKGVDKVTSGYAGGHVPKPTYRAVCDGTTGHAEALQIIFDPKTITYKDILRIFFTTHDPTTLNRQGADSGTQYRSAIFTHNDGQKKAAQEVIKEVTAEKLYSNKIVTEVTAFTNFYAAEDYHQDYYAQNSDQNYCRVVIAPKVAKFREKYREKLKK